MFLLPLLALLAGFILFYIPLSGYSLAESVAPYTAIALLAGMDTVLGGWRAWLIDEFDEPVFVTGFFVNALLAAGSGRVGRASWFAGRFRRRPDFHYDDRRRCGFFLTYF